MTPRSVTHDTFVVERSYDATPARVFAAFADPTQKARWFGDGSSSQWSLDFREGGRETSRGTAGEGGPEYSFEATYYDIVPDERIVYSYEMHMNGARISVSLAVVEITSQGDQTRLVVTEQGAYLDGLDRPQDRRQGTEDLMDALGRTLTSEPANA